MAQNFFDQFDEQPGVPGVQVKPADPMRGLDTRIKELEIAQKTQALQPKPPEGFRYTQDGLEPIPGGPADPKNKGRSGEEASRDETRIGNLRALERQIAEVRRLYAEGPGKTKGLKGLKDYVGTDANKAFDTAAAALADIGNAAFKVPGMGPQSDADAARFVAANQPSSGDRDVQIEQKLNALERRLAEAYAAAKVEPLGLVPALQPKGPRAPDLGLATGAQKFEPSDKASALATEMARAGMSDEQINAALTAGGFSTLTPKSIEQVRDFLKDHPDFQGVVPGAGAYKPTTLANRLTATPGGAFVGNYLDAASGGLPSLMAGQEGRDAMQLLAAENPTEALLGGMAGGVTATLGAGKFLNGTRLAPWIAANSGKATMLGDMAYGGTYGFNTADEGQGALGAGTGAFGALVGNRAGAGLARGAGATMRGVVDPSVQFLRERGIPLTGGQMAGGLLKRIEDTVAGYGLAGSSLRNRLGEGVEALNRHGYDIAGEPIGNQATDVGRAGLDALNAAKGQAYRDSLGQMNLTLDPGYTAQRAAADASGAALPDTLRPTYDATLRKVDSFVQPGGVVPGTSAQAIKQTLRGEIKANRGTPGGQFVNDALGQADSAFMDMAARQAPEATALYKNADLTHGRSKVLEKAVNAASGKPGDPGLWTGAQLASALKGPNVTQDSIRALAPLAEHAVRVLPSQVPDSGTAGRLALGALGAGSIGGAAGYAAGGQDAAQDGGVLGLGTAATLALLNTKAGRKTMEKLLMDRFDVMRNAGSLTIKAAPYTGMFGRGAGATTAGLIYN